MSTLNTPAHYEFEPFLVSGKQPTPLVEALREYLDKVQRRQVGLFSDSCLPSTTLEDLLMIFRQLSSASMRTRQSLSATKIQLLSTCMRRVQNEIAFDSFRRNPAHFSNLLQNCAFGTSKGISYIPADFLVSRSSAKTADFLHLVAKKQFQAALPIGFLKADFFRLRFDQRLILALAETSALPELSLSLLLLRLIARCYLLANVSLVYFVHFHSFLARLQTADESFSSGVFGLIRAVELFDHRAGSSFQTYAFRWIKTSLVNDFSNETLIRHPRRFYERADIPKSWVNAIPFSAIETDPAADEKTDWLLSRLGKVPSPERILLWKDAAAVIARVLDSMSERNRHVLQLRFGFADGTPKTLDEIGGVFGVSRERARQVEKHALQIFRRRLLQSLSDDRAASQSVTTQLSALFQYLEKP